MKRLYKILICMALCLAGGIQLHGANGIIEKRYYHICPGDVITIDAHQTRISSDTILYDTLHLPDPTADSIYVYIVNMYPRFEKDESRVLTAGSSIDWCDTTLRTTGYYERIYKTIHGCDSIYRMHLTVEALHDEKNVTICDGEKFSWRGKIRDVPGQYIDVDKDEDGNVIAEYILNLTILPKREQRITVDICQGGSYSFGGRTLTQSGVYTHVYHVDGCDSTVILSLNVLNADTLTDVATLVPETPYVWSRDNKSYTEPGVYYHFDTNERGCTVTEILILTENHIDTFDTTATVCPSELPFEWHGIRAFSSGEYKKAVKQPDGSYVWYRLNLTVRELVQETKDFVICADGSVTYNGKTYTEAGYFTDYLGCDTVVTIHISKKPIVVHETQASLGGNHGYYWSFQRDGEVIDSVFYDPGTYEFVSQNETTGCNDLWRLILSQDETSYHFVETMTICEGDDFVWHNLHNLSNIPGTHHYFAEYKTRNGQDSIYELELTVTPMKRTMQTLYFCGSIEWKGVTYTESTIVYDTIATEEGCYELRRTNLDKAYDFYRVDNWKLVQGDSLIWHGQTIYGDGVYYDHQKTIHGCDSTYELHVEMIPASPETNMYVDQRSICHGDTLRWRGKDIWAGGRYVDTVKTLDGDSIFILYLNEWPSYKDVITRHLYTCGEGTCIRYQGQDYWKDTTLLDTLASIHGCDSIVQTFLHFNTALNLSDTIKIPDTQLPYTWHYRLGGTQRDTTLTCGGTYLHQEEAEGGCYNREELVLIVYPTYLFEESLVVCESELPFHWMNGPIDHRNDDLMHTVGTTKQYEYRYPTINNTDSIFRLQLRIDPSPKDTVQIRFCEGEQVKVGDKVYVNIQSDTIFRVTATVPNPDSGCDSIIYYEIYQYPSKQSIATEVLHPNDTIYWRDQVITTPGWFDAQPDSIDAATGCPIIDRLHVIADLRESRVICSNDTAEDTHPDKKYPYIWNSPSGQGPDTLYASGLYTDTVFDGNQTITAFYSLDLTVTQPFDTTVYIHGCKNQGAWWHDVIYYEDSLFIDRIPVDPHDPMQPCDSVFHVHIIIDTVYTVIIDTTLCEYQLPLIIGKVNPDTIWEEKNFQHIGDLTTCGCDSIIMGSLKIIPKLTRNDSTFVCESFFEEGGVVTLGDTDHPAFLDNDGDKWAGKWEGKWTGVHYTADTIVWDCDSNYFHHIIMRPSQKVPFDTTYYMCEGDSAQLFWPKTQWIKKDTIYFDTVPMGYTWTDEHHGYTYHRQDYLCDSVIRWTVKFVHPEQKDTTAHILLGDSLWWGGAWRYYTGSYDSIGVAKEKNSDSIPCQLTYTLHLIADTMYYFNDTVDICSTANKTHNYTWASGYVTTFNVPDKDSTFHVVDSLITYDRRDSIYDLFVQFRLVPTTLLYDSICEGDSLRFDIHRGTTTIERWLTTRGTYTDTLDTPYGCDSIIQLRLYVYNRNEVAHSTVHIADTVVPYLWTHQWQVAGQPKTQTDTLYASGEYRFLMPSIHGCDSIDSLSLFVHKTYRIQEDSIYICANETPYTWQDRNDITSSCDLVFHALTQDGYDSVRYVHIEVLPVFKTTVLIDTICEGDSLRFGLTRQNTPRFLTTGGVYYDTLTSHLYGCDSIIELRLNVYPHYHHYTRVDISDKQIPYLWNHIQGGQIIETESLNGTGEYVYVFTSRFGCDSIDSLSLHIHQTYEITEDTIDLCSDETPFTWCDRNNISETGDYTYYGQTVEGYDSIRHIHINVWPVQYTTIRHSMCDGSTYIFGSKQKQLSEGGTYTDTLTGYHGCDSIVTLILTVNPPYYNTRTEHIIEGNSVVWYDTIVSESGTYPHYAKTPDGCDSTSILQLIVHPAIDTVVTVCTSELPYPWVNKWTGQTSLLYTAGVYRNDTSYDANGERLYYGLQLIVNQPTDSTMYQTICEGDGFNFNGTLLRKSGEYRDTVKNSLGCDSVIILHLNVLPKYYNTVERSIYEGDTVHFEGETYSVSGAYPVRYTSTFGCDSVIELRLTVNRLYDDSVSVCSNDLPFEWRNQSIFESGIYRDTLRDETGLIKSVVGLKVQVLPTARLADPLVVTICEGTEYRFGLTRFGTPRILTENGTYYDTLIAANGCDSIVSLVLQVQPINHVTDNKTIFMGDSVEFHGEWYKESGQYEYKTLNSLGCEDVHTLVLTVLSSFNTDTVATVCKNELPFIWRDYEYYESGDYTLPISWTDSSRVTMTLHLTVNDVFYREQNLALCEGDTIVFKNRQYYSNGFFYDTVPSLVGCDSVVKYIVSVHPTFDRIFEKHISDDSTYIWHERELSQTGTYEWTGKTVQGCDSIEHLILTVHPSFFQSDTIDLCQSDTANYPFRWTDINGRLIATITQSGTYNDSVLTEYGFDSVHQVVVYVHPAYLINEQYEIGEGEVLKIHGKTISEPIVYTDTMRTIFGCDSIFHVVVNAKRTLEFTWNKTICQGDYFEWLDGRKLTRTGKYVYTSQYKDSIVTLFLTVNPISISEERIVITSKQLPYIHDGHLYEQQGVYSDTSMNAFGCDSIHRLVLVVTDRYSDWDPIPLCPGAEIKIDGQVITEAGLYTFLRRSRVTGELDSIYRVEVYDAPAYDLPLETRTICDGDTLFIGGKAVTRAGHYDFALKTTEGCDSLLHLDLTVNPSYRYFTDATIRDFETYTWMGKTYSTEGSYDRTWPTIHDCDSTYTLRLTVVPTQRFITVDTICDGQTYTWRGKDYKLDGYYTDTVYRPETFYSAIYTLQLTVMRPTFITSANVSDICADDKSFDISFTYTGARPSTYSIFFDQLAKNEGFVDVINRPFLGEDRVATGEVPAKTEVVYLDHTAYVRPNKYGLRLVLDNGVCGKSQSDSLAVLVKYPSWIIEQNWNDVVAPLKKTYNGGYEFSQTDWYINGSLQPNNGLGYLQSNKLKDGDEVTMVATRKGDNYSIPTCPLVIKIDNTTAYEEPILVYPTRAPRYAARITIEAPQGGEYAIYSSTGTLISSGHLAEGAMQVNLPPTCGMYFVRTTHNDQSDTHKVVIY